MNSDQVVNHINEQIADNADLGMSTDEISDGHHTFGELYEHRYTLFMALCKEQYDWHTSEGLGEMPWRSKLHSDGTSYDGWFILGIHREAGRQITYHLPMSKWEDCWFTDELDRAPGWDGHTSADVLRRLSTRRQNT